MRSRASLTRLTVPGAITTPPSVDTPAARSGNDLLIEAAPVGRVPPPACGSRCGSNRQCQPSGAPGNGEEQDGCSGEDSQGAHRDRGGKRLRCSETRGDERGGSGACLGGCAGWPDRQRCGGGTGAEKQEREWERVAESEGAEEDEAGHSANEPAAEDERPCLRCAVQGGRARAQPAAEPEAQGAFASGEAWQGHDHRGGCHTGRRYDRERGTRADPGSWKGHCDGSQRRQRGAVDQTEHDKREADRPQPGGTAWVAAYDRDSHRIVEAAGKDDTDQRGTAVPSNKRKRRGPLAVRKKP